MKKIRFSALLFLAVLVLGLAGCEKKSRKNYEGVDTVWYLNPNGDGLVQEEYRGPAESDDAKLDEFLDLFRMAPEGSSNQALLPPDVAINRVSIEGVLLTLDFSASYERMDPIREVLVRAGIVRTLVQLHNVSKVCFTTDGREVVTQSGKILGFMDADSFIENSGKQINATQNSTINLYFADDTGTKLNRESRSIYYSANKTLEWAIVERIIAGPKVSGNYATVPQGAQIISVTSANGVCYVNLTHSFISSAFAGINERIPIYSIVDSIIDNNRDITSVQISIEGSSDWLFRDAVDLSSPLQADFSLLSGEE